VATAVRHHPDGRTEWLTFAGLRANLELTARLGPLWRGTSVHDTVSIDLADEVTAYDLRLAMDRVTPADELITLAKEATAGLNFADCLPDWLADTILLTRMSEPVAVEAALTYPVDSVHPL
jgi:hypothetical protein